MQLTLDKPLRVPEYLDLDTQGVGLRLSIPADQVLSGASLTLAPSSSASLTLAPEPALQTEFEGFEDIPWLQASWGKSRTVHQFALRTGAATPEGLKIRVLWDSSLASQPEVFPYPAGPADVDLAGTFDPAVTATWLKFEFLDSNGVARPITLAAARPLKLSFASQVSSVIMTDAGLGKYTNIRWITADWGRPRAVRQFSLKAGADTAEAEWVRVLIARGGSGWYSPPGTDTFPYAPVAKEQEIAISFPATVADRLMLEFLDANWRPKEVSLDGSEPLDLSFTSQARDITLSVGQGRPFFRHEGEVVVPVAVDNLFEAIAKTIPGELTDTEVALWLRAEVAGAVLLTGSFQATRILREFSGGQVRRELSLPWGDQVREEITIAGALQELSLQIDSQPVQERMLLQPTPAALTTAEARLCRPLYDNAQAFTIEGEGPIVGVDLWARPLSKKTRIRATLVPDNQGRPGPTPGAELVHSEVSVQDPQAPHNEARWLTLDFDKPRGVPGTPYWWLVITVQEGELLWFLGEDPPRGVGETRYRRGKGAWLQRERERESTGPLTIQSPLLQSPLPLRERVRERGQQGAQTERLPWALSRLRAADDVPPSSLEAKLIISPQSDIQQPAIKLPIGEDGGIAWRPDGQAPEVESIALEFCSSVATRLTLSALRVAIADDPGEDPEPDDGR